MRDHDLVNLGSTQRAKAARQRVEFRVLQRDNDGLHWDIFVDGDRRFTIRGEAGNITLLDTNEKVSCPFRSAEGALSYAMEEMVHAARKATP